MLRLLIVICLFTLSNYSFGDTPSLISNLDLTAVPTSSHVSVDGKKLVVLL